MVKPLPITPTLLDTFLTCPRQYQAKYVTKEVVFQQNAAAAYGDRIHKAVQAALETKTILPSEAAFMQPLVEWCNALSSQPATHMFVERKLAITRDLKRTDWKNGWLRGMADVMFVDNLHQLNIIIDWKTGKKRGTSQDEILALCAAHTTGWKNVLCLWVYVQQSELHCREFKVYQFDGLKNLMDNIGSYESACQNDNFAPTPNGLCKQWCDVLSCPHNGKRK